MPQRMNSHTGTTGTVTVSATPIPTYLGSGWMPDNLVAAALSAGWTNITIPDDRGNPATTRSAQIDAPGTWGCWPLDAVGGGYLARAGIISGRLEHGVVSIFDCGTGLSTDCGPANLLCLLSCIPGPYVVVNQRFLNGLTLSAYARSPGIGVPHIGLQYN